MTSVHFTNQEPIIDNKIEKHHHPYYWELAGQINCLSRTFQSGTFAFLTEMGRL